MGNVDAVTAGQRRRTIAGRAGRIDVVLADAFPDLSRARIQRLIAGGHALLNGECARKSAAVVEGDTLELALPPRSHVSVRAEECPDLAILFEDQSVVAVDKPAGLAVHGAPGDTSPSVAQWMLARLGSGAGGFDADHPGIVHRLDKDTSGVLLLAKTPRAQSAVSAAFEARTVEKTYLAVTDAVPNRRRAVIDAPIARHPGDRTRMAVVRNGRTSRTGYEVLGEDHGRALILVHPETGRTHQIRVHLAAIHCPVTFDRVYGTEGEGRQLLHAWRIRIPHPDGGMLEVTSPLAPDFAAFVRHTALEPLASEYMRAAPASRTTNT
jgi:23S rRNA pseudouridine1911/1915/1917 synthase